MDANDLYKSGDTDVALLMYMLLAEMGFEMAQSNAAYILDKGITNRRFVCVMNCDCMK